MKPANKPLTPLGCKKLIWIAASIVALATFIVYLPALQNGFVNWDEKYTFMKTQTFDPWITDC